MVIIGITGTLGAGKGTIVEYLVTRKGFLHFSVRDYLVKEIVKRKMEVNRDSMVAVANELREIHHPAWLIEKLYEEAVKAKRNCIIESIRTAGEVNLLRKEGNFFLLAVDAEPQTRYKRIRIRNSETDRISNETFIENEEREMDSDNPNHQNLRKCIEMADYVLENNKSVKSLYAEVDKIIDNILKLRK